MRNRDPRRALPGPYPSACGCRRPASMIREAHVRSGSRLPRPEGAGSPGRPQRGPPHPPCAAARRPRRRWGPGGRGRARPRRDGPRPAEGGPRPAAAAWSLRAESWPEGFRARPPAPPLLPPRDLQPVTPEPARPAVHVMPMWEPSPPRPAPPVAGSGEPPVEAGEGRGAVRAGRRPMLRRGRHGATRTRSRRATTARTACAAATWSSRPGRGAGCRPARRAADDLGARRRGRGEYLSGGRTGA